MIDKAGVGEVKEYIALLHIKMKQGIKTLAWLIFISAMTYVFFLILQHYPQGWLKGLRQEGRRIYQFLERQLK